MIADCRGRPGRRRHRRRHVFAQLLRPLYIGTRATRRHDANALVARATDDGLLSKLGVALEFLQQSASLDTLHSNQAALWNSARCAVCMWSAFYNGRRAGGSEPQQGGHFVALAARIGALHGAQPATTERARARVAFASKRTDVKVHSQRRSYLHIYIYTSTYIYK